MKDTTTLAEGKYLKLVKIDRWEFVQRKNVSGIVGIIPVTDAGEIVLVEQFRMPMDASVIELPAGLAGDTDDASESLATAARRELLEETGFIAGEMTEVAHGPVSAGLSTEIVTMFLARSLSRSHAGGGDGTENITTHVVPLATIDAWLADQQKQGKMIDLKVYCGLRFV